MRSINRNADVMSCGHHNAYSSTDGSASGWRHASCQPRLELKLDLANFHVRQLASPLLGELGLILIERRAEGCSTGVPDDLTGVASQGRHGTSPESIEKF